MASYPIQDLGHGRLLIDLGFRGSPGLIASYLLPEEEGWTMIETGPTTCRPTLLAGLDSAGIERREIRRVVVTHIHLDHAGGMGSLVAEFPRATFYAHAAGVPHLVDPRRLEASARLAWGPQMDRLFGAMVAMPADRIQPLSGGERWNLRSGSLDVIATPGHARHHLAFLDSATSSLFTGDAAGVRLAGGWRTRPAVPPPDLDLELLYGSLDRMGAVDPRRLLRSHFGPDPGGAKALVEYREIVEEWRAVAWSAFRESTEPGYIAERLKEYETERQRAAGHAPSGADTGLPFSDFELAAQGFAKYFQRRMGAP